MLLISAVVPLGSAAAQAAGDVRFVVSLGRSDSAGPTPEVRVEGLLAQERWLSALRSGLPLRLGYRLELWRSRGGWFDNFERQVEWDVLVRREPLLDQYTMITIFLGRRQERRFATLDALSAALAFSYRVAVRPAGPGRYYYASSVAVTTLSDSDIDELDQFLQRDLGGVAEGEQSLGSAVGRGATRFLMRLAGLPSVRFEGRTPQFTVGGGE